MTTVPKTVIKIPVNCNLLIFSIPVILPNITAIIGLIEEIGVAIDAPISLMAVMNAEVPITQPMIPDNDKNFIDLILSSLSLSLYLVLASLEDIKIIKLVMPMIMVLIDVNPKASVPSN